MRSSCRLLLRSRGPSEGHYCPFMGCTVWEVRRGRARRWVRPGNEGGLEVLAIAWDWSSSQSNSKAHTFGKRLLYNRWVWLRRTAQVMDKGIFIGTGLRWKRELDFAPTRMRRRSRDAQQGLASAAPSQMCEQIFIFHPVKPFSRLQSRRCSGAKGTSQDPPKLQNKLENKQSHWFIHTLLYPKSQRPREVGRLHPPTNNIAHVAIAW